MPFKTKKFCLAVGLSMPVIVNEGKNKFTQHTFSPLVAVTSSEQINSTDQTDLFFTCLFKVSLSSGDI